MSEPRPPRLAFETRITLLALAAGAPALAFALYVLWTSGGYSSKVQWTLALLFTGAWLGFAFAARDRVVRPLQTLSNLLAALQEGDYSIRARGSRRGDALDALVGEVNALSRTLQTQRIGAMEAAALLGTVMAEIDVAVFTFDDGNRLRLVNRAGERLLDSSADRLLGASAEEIGIEGFFEEPGQAIVQRAFPGGAGRWGVRMSSFREEGRPHRLLVIADLTRTLREEELQAWKRLVRVLGHELNNSLTPIRSIAGSLTKLVDRDPMPEDWREDTLRGLGVIAGRSEALTRFLDSYARLAKLPPPRIADVDVAAWVQRVAALESRGHVAVEPGPAFVIPGDGDQLDQALINLVKNAVEAGGGVTVTWRRSGKRLGNPTIVFAARGAILEACESEAT
ncbi:MAG: PAS domain-containing sensor histidine kinase, partial [Acidobacteria bacterium]|nr:PAS domain-containing sensor histidine kinase [Acidobacteriota bacterium]